MGSGAGEFAWPAGEGVVVFFVNGRRAGWARDPQLKERDVHRAEGIARLPAKAFRIRIQVFHKGLPIER